MPVLFNKAEAQHRYPNTRSRSGENATTQSLLSFLSRFHGFSPLVLYIHLSSSTLHLHSSGLLDVFLLIHAPAFLHIPFFGTVRKMSHPFSSIYGLFSVVPSVISVSSLCIHFCHPLNCGMS